MDDGLTQQPSQPSRREGWLARAVGAALDWGRRNPVSAGWLGACAFILILVYVQALAHLVERGPSLDDDDDGGGDGGSRLDGPPPVVPPDPVREPDPAPAPVVDPAPAPANPAPTAPPSGEGETQP